mgnify:FL=1
MDKIYDEYYYKVYKWSISKTKNKEDAEDLTNNIFLAVFEYLNKNIPIEKLENLIWKIAYNLWCTKAKNYDKEKRNMMLDEDFQYISNEDPLDKIIYKDIITNLDNLGLTINEKTSFQLYYLKDLSIKEISNALNTKESTIKYYLYNARNKIKERYHE